MKNDEIMTLGYDEKFDILYVNFHDGTPLYEDEKFSLKNSLAIYGVEKDDGVVYKLSELNDICRGLIIFDFNERCNNNTLPQLYEKIPNNITITDIIDKFKHQFHHQYTLIFLFNEDYSKVLLVYKNRGPYVNKFNGIGGKLEEEECPVTGAIREAYEEVGVNLISKINYLGLYHPNINVDLHVFYALVNENDVSQKEDEPIKWFKVNTITDHEIDFISDVYTYIQEVLYDITEKEGINNENTCK